MRPGAACAACDGRQPGMPDGVGLLQAALRRDAADLVPSQPAKRARARLWELNESIHCSIIGTCLTTGELRRVMAKVVREGVSGVSDHDLHSQAVGLCNQHSPAAKLLHKALDQRHELVIKRFAQLQRRGGRAGGLGEQRSRATSRAPIGRC